MVELFDILGRSFMARSFGHKETPRLVVENLPGKYWMININFKTIAHEHTWFGWWYFVGYKADENKWNYSMFWSDRLWPVRHYTARHPSWWRKILPRLIK